MVAGMVPSLPYVVIDAAGREIAIREANSIKSSRDKRDIRWCSTDPARCDHALQAPEVIAPAGSLHVSGSSRHTVQRSE